MLKQKTIGIILVILAFLIILGTIVSHIINDYWSESWFTEGVWVEFHGVIIEVIVFAVIYGNYVKYKEKTQINPARIRLGLRLHSLHVSLFNSLRWLVDSSHHTDPNSHGFPEGTTQEEADAWGRANCVRYLDGYYEDYAKMLSYSNALIGNEMFSKVIVYIEYARELIGTCKFIASAFEVEKRNFKHECRIGKLHLEEMKGVHDWLLQTFPEIKVLETPSYTPDIEPFTPEQLIELMEKSNEELSFLHISVY